jgi:putative N-acetylmannosamine-6-phosphate epimerase
MSGKGELDETQRRVQEVLAAISGSEVLAEGKKRELISRIRSVGSTLEGNRNKTWMYTEEGKERLRDLGKEAGCVLIAFGRLEEESDHLEELEERITDFRISARKVVEVIKK